MKARIESDLRTAMKDRDAIAAETCRMLLAAIKNEEVAKRRPLTDEETLALLNRAVKTRQEAVALYEKGGRADLADKERREIDVVRRYVPEPLTAAELAAAVDAVVRELGATSKKDLGRVMKALMARHPGRVDGRLANRIAGARLT